MSSDVVIRAEGLGKKYMIGHQSDERYKLLREVMNRTAKNFAFAAREMLRGKALVAADEVEEFWALKNVNFEIRRGDVVGIIGRNGTGKSTLLKVLSRITEPSEGRVAIKGKVASLLEVGTGFHPELTGRENVYLNGAILGMTRAEIRRKFDEIVDFAGVEKFLDTPVKRYSSGMYVRLAFAVAAHLEPEVLIVDEVLAVGDAEFQTKCLGKMRQVADQGRTVILVSHNLSVIRRLCERVFVMQRGILAYSGTANDGIDFYERSMISTPNLATLKFEGELTDGVKFNQVQYRQHGQYVDIVDANALVILEIRGQALRPLRGVDIQIAIFKDGFMVMNFFDTDKPEDLVQGPFITTIELPSHTLSAGPYTVGLGALEAGGKWCWAEDVARLDVSWTTHEIAFGRNPGPVRVPCAATRTQ
jgi:ABC-type polysaccharide/polyol phosphate transport system ATPase subunit